MRHHKVPSSGSSSSRRSAKVPKVFSHAANPRFVAWDLELLRDGPSYTVDTVSRLLEERPEDTVVVIVGSDTFPEMASWRDPTRLFALCTVAVVSRPGESESQAPPGAPFPGSRGVEQVRGPGLPISSTVIRQRVREGRSVRYLVPDGVADYIAQRGLYG